jgi:hypothetical protein
LASQLYTSVKLFRPNLADDEAVNQASHIEEERWRTSNSKEEYMQTTRQRLNQIMGWRQQQMNAIQHQSAMNNASLSMMGQSGMPNQRPNPPQQTPQPFPNAHLQRPMQASPIPMTQSQSQMGMNSAVNGANAPGPQQQHANPRPPQQQQSGQLFNPGNERLFALARNLMNTAAPQFHEKMRQDVEMWPATKRDSLRAKGIDPLLWRYREHIQGMINQKQGKPFASQQHPPGAGQGDRFMQQLGQPNPMMGQQFNLNQRHQGMVNAASGQNLDPNELANQQLEALRVQDQGQQVVPASNNPTATPMMSFGGQTPQSTPAQNNFAQRQAFASAQAAQRQAHAQAQAQQAQAQAQGQATQQMLMRQQMGNPNGPSAPQQNGQMPLLTRPMVPTGHQGPTTPQQRPQSHVPQMTPQVPPQVDPQIAAQLMQEAHQRATALQPQPQTLTTQERMKLLGQIHQNGQQLPEAVRNKLLNLPDQQFRAFMQRNRRPQGPAMMGNGQFPESQPQVGQPTMQMNPAQGLPMGLQQTPTMNAANMNTMNQQQSMIPGQQQQQLLNAPGPPQMMAPQGVVNHQRMLHAQSIIQNSPQLLAAMDNQPYPPRLVDAQARQHLPPDVRTWGQLKTWAKGNPPVAGLELSKLNLFQALGLIDRQAHITAQRQQEMAGQRFPSQNVNANQAPQARMAGVPPVQGPPRPGPQLGDALLHQTAQSVTPQEMLSWRQRLPPQQQSVPDQQLRLYIAKVKLKNHEQQQQHRQLQQMQMQGNQMSQPIMTPQAQQISRPPTQPPPATQPVPTAKPMNKAPQPPKTAQPPVQQPAQASSKQGVKRPHEDANEHSGPSSSVQNAAPQAPPMAISKSQQGMPSLTAQQMASLTPQQQAQVRERLLKAQDLTNKPQQGTGPSQPFRQLSFREVQARLKDPVNEQKMKQILAEEEQKAPRGAPVPLGPEQRASIQNMLRSSQPSLKRLDWSMRVFLASYESGSGPEDIFRKVARSRALLYRQLNPHNGSLVDEVTINEHDFEEAVRNSVSFVQKVLRNFALLTKAMEGQQSAQQQPDQPQDAQSAKQPPTQRQDTAKAPPPPTTDKPPFPLGVQSPSGVPIYPKESAIKPDDLRLPKSKRQKVDPVHRSPDLKRPEKPVEQKPNFKCKDSSCDWSVRGFDTQAELDAHFKESHAKIDDPLQFALNAAADFSNIDITTGEPFKPKDTSASTTGAKPNAQPAKGQTAKSGQTPNVTTPAQTAATPMGRVATQTNAAKGSPSTNLLRTPQSTAKAATPGTAMPARPASTSTSQPQTKDAGSERVTQLEDLDVESLFELDPSTIFNVDEMLAAADANGPYTTLDLDDDSSWMLRSSSDSPSINTPDTSAKSSPFAQGSANLENAKIHIDLGVNDLPEAWLATLQGNSLPINAQLSDDLQALNVELPLEESDNWVTSWYGDMMGPTDFGSAGDSKKPEATVNMSDLMLMNS